MPPLPQVILFDAGNTLIHPAEPVGKTYAAIAAHYGVTVEEAVLQEGFSRAWKMHKPTLATVTAGGHYSKNWWKSIVREAWRECAIPEGFPFDDYFDEVFSAYEQPHLWRVFPDAEVALEKLAEKKIRLGILSNWDSRLRIILNRLDLAAYFEHVIISDEVGFCKPDTRIYQLAAERFEVPVGEVLLVGDDPECDGSAAASAGMTSEVVARPQKDLMDILNLFIP